MYERALNCYEVLNLLIILSFFDPNSHSIIMCRPTTRLAYIINIKLNIPINWGWLDESCVSIQSNSEQFYKFGVLRSFLNVFIQVFLDLIFFLKVPITSKLSFFLSVGILVEIIHFSIMKFRKCF